MLSILLAVRKNSKFFAKFMAGFLLHTKDFKNVELLVMASQDDTWNRDLFELYKDRLTVYFENYQAGAGGRYLFYNDLAKYAKGDWLWHMADDHYLLDGYDEYLADHLKPYNSRDVLQVVPRVENSGSISHLVSRGWYETTGRIGAHGNIDSYLNRVAERVLDQSRILHPDKPVLIDFTVDQTIMTPEHTKTEIKYPVYPFTDPRVENDIDIDALKIYEATR